MELTAGSTLQKNRTSFPMSMSVYDSNFVQIISFYSPIPRLYVSSVYSSTESVPTSSLRMLEILIVATVFLVRWLVGNL